MKSATLSEFMLGASVAPTTHICACTPAHQHAGVRDLIKQEAPSPAAEHFMHPGALNVFVRRFIASGRLRDDSQYPVASQSTFLRNGDAMRLTRGQPLAGRAPLRDPQFH
jgi:hypothetical protein